MKEVAIENFNKAVAQAPVDLYEAALADGIELGKKEVGGFSQADIDAAKKAGFDQAVAADTTPISQEKYDALKALFDKDEEKLTAVEAILHPVVAAPVPAPAV